MFFTASSLLSQGNKLRSVGRSSSRPNKTSIHEKWSPCFSIKLSPKVSEAASSAAIPAAAAAIKAHDEETNFVAFKDEHDNLLIVNSVNTLEDILDELSMKESNYFNKDRNTISLFQECLNFAV